MLIQSFYTTWLPTYLVNERKLSLASMGIYASLPWVAMFASVFLTGALGDAILRRTGSIWAARVPLAIAGFVVSALALITAARTPQVAPMMVLLCVSLGAVGVTQVSIWPSTQDLGGAATGIVSGWTNFWGNAAGVAGPVLTAYLVRWTGSWSGALIGIALAGVAGAVLWLFVHPQRGLVDRRPVKDLVMGKYEIDPMPPQISGEVIALLEQAETATVGHWRHWGFCDRRIQPLLRRKRVAGTAVTLAIPGR